MNASRSFLWLALAFALLSPTAAHAGGIIFNYGDTITKLGDITPENQRAYPDYQVGYKFDSFGIFYADLWTFGGTYCIFYKDDCKPIDATEAARLMGTTGSVSPPLLYRFPLGLLIIGSIIVGAGLLGAWEKFTSRNLGVVVPYAMYQKALQLVKTQLSNQTIGAPQRTRLAKEAGVDYLIGQGIGRADAERKVAQMLDKLAPGRSV